MLKYSFTDRFLFSSPLLQYSAFMITYFNWFMIITFFFKKGLTISNYFIFDCFFYFFKSKKYLVAQSSIYFLNLKRFFVSFIILSSLFLFCKSERVFIALKILFKYIFRVFFKFHFFDSIFQSLYSGEKNI